MAFIDPGPPEGWERFPEIERRALAAVVGELELLILRGEKWVAMPEGMRRRDPYVIGPYVRAAVADLKATLDQAVSDYGAIEMCGPAEFGFLADMLDEEAADRWPEGLTAGHVHELKTYLGYLKPPEAQQDPPAEDHEPAEVSVDTDRHQITIKGHTYTLSPDQAVLVAILFDEARSPRPERISLETIARRANEVGHPLSHPERIRDSLPPQVHARIDKTPKGHLFMLGHSSHI